jgi:hypothetical protein
LSKTYKEQIAHQILKDIAQVNPYTATDKSKGALYAAGFLAGYLAQLAESDPWVYKRLKQHIEQRKY